MTYVTEGEHFSMDDEGSIYVPTVIMPYEEAFIESAQKENKSNVVEIDGAPHVLLHVALQMTSLAERTEGNVDMAHTIDMMEVRRKLIEINFHANEIRLKRTEVTIANENASASLN